MSISASKILVPIGFSAQSMIALGQAFNLAKIKKSDVVLLSVVEEQSMMQSLFLDSFILTSLLSLSTTDTSLIVASQYLAYSKA